MTSVHVTWARPKDLTRHVLGEFSSRPDFCFLFWFFSCRTASCEGAFHHELKKEWMSGIHVCGWIHKLIPTSRRCQFCHHNDSGLGHVERVKIKFNLLSNTGAAFTPSMYFGSRPHLVLVIALTPTRIFTMKHRFFISKTYHRRGRDIAVHQNCDLHSSLKSCTQKTTDQDAVLSTHKYTSLTSTRYG